MAIFFILSAIETIALGTYLVSIGSEAKSQIVFNLSLSRLATSGGVFLVALSFIFLAILATLRYTKGNGLFNRFLTSKKSLLGSVILTSLVSILMFFLITRQPGYGGLMKLFLIQLEPVLVWIMVLSAQAALFAFVWFCAYFIINREKESIRATKQELLHVFAIFFFALAAKWIFVSSNSFGPTGIGDEMTYYDMADSMNRGFFSVAQTYHYPPLYPFTFLPALVFGEYTFTLIKFFNAAITTTIIFPTYFLSRSFLSPQKSLIPTAIACLIPYHLVFPRRIVSENLYFPIFLWSMVLTLKKPAQKSIKLVWDIFTGVTLGLLYLTRYISLAVIPMFLLSWWMKPFEEGESIFHLNWKKMVRGLMILAFAIVVFSPWIIAGVGEDVPLKLTLGFGITSRTNPEQLTLGKLAMWASLYLFYIILYAAPFLPLLLKSLGFIDLKKSEDEFGRLIMQLVIIMTGFLAAATRHSWRAYYNLTMPAHILGRYVVYFSVPFLIIAFVTLDRIQNKRESSNFFFHIGITALSLGFAYLAHSTIIEGSVFRIGENFLNPAGSVDGYYVKEMGDLFYIFLLVLYTFYMLVFIGKGNRLSLKAASVLFIIFYTIKIGDYQQVLVSDQTYPWLSSKVAAFARASIEDDELSDKITIFVPKTFTSNQVPELYNGLRVRGIDSTEFIRMTDEVPSYSERDYQFILKEYDSESQSDMIMDNRIRFLDKEFSIEQIDN